LSFSFLSLFVQGSFATPQHLTSTRRGEVLRFGRVEEVLDCLGPEA
jgi:hypothetical protein